MSVVRSSKLHTVCQLPVYQHVLSSCVLLTQMCEVHPFLYFYTLLRSTSKQNTLYMNFFLFTLYKLSLNSFITVLQSSISGKKWLELGNTLSQQIKKQYLGALKREESLIGCLVQMSTIFQQDRGLHLHILTIFTRPPLTLLHTHTHTTPPPTHTVSSKTKLEHRQSKHSPHIPQTTFCCHGYCALSHVTYRLQALSCVQHGQKGGGSLYSP